MPESSPWDDIAVPGADFNVRQVAVGTAVPCFWGRDAGGACLFIVATISRLDILEMFKGIWPFILVALGVLSLLILFPSLTLWLPRLLK